MKSDLMKVYRFLCLAALSFAVIPAMGQETAKSSVSAEVDYDHPKTYYVVESPLRETTSSQTSR